MPFSRFNPCEPCCHCETTLCVQVRTACGPVAGAVVSIDEIPGDTCVTDNYGSCCMLVEAGTWTVRVSFRGGDYTQTVDLSECHSRAISFLLEPGPDGQICFTVLGCPTAPFTAIGPLEGATVQLMNSASPPTADYQCTTDASGQCCVSVSDFVPRNVVVLPPTTGCSGFSPGGTPPGFQISATACGSVYKEFTLAPDGSHICCGTVLIKTTLQVSFSGFTTAVPWVGFGWQTCVLVPTMIYPGSCPTEPPFVPPQVPGTVAATITISCLTNLHGEFLGLRVRLEWDSGYCVPTRDPITGDNPVFKVFHTRTSCPVLVEDSEAPIPCPEPFPYSDDCNPCVGSGLTGVVVDVPRASMSTCPIDFTTGLPSLTKSVPDPCGIVDEFGNPVTLYDVDFPLPGTGNSITVTE